MTPHIGQALGGGSAQGRAKYHSEETKSASGWDLGISTAVYGDARGGIRVDGGVRSKEAEYGSQYIMTQPIMDLCNEKVHMPR